MLSGGLNGVLTLYRLDGTPRATLVGHTGRILAVAISGDGRWALSGRRSNPGTVVARGSPDSGPDHPAPHPQALPRQRWGLGGLDPEGFFAASIMGRERA